jgi:hypothetical protein
VGEVEIGIGAGALLSLAIFIGGDWLVARSGAESDNLKEEGGAVCVVGSEVLITGGVRGRPGSVEMVPSAETMLDNSLA